jgi:hypothetical protein
MIGKTGTQRAEAEGLVTQVSTDQMSYALAGLVIRSRSVSLHGLSPGSLPFRVFQPHETIFAGMMIQCVPYRFARTKRMER